MAPTRSQGSGWSADAALELLYAAHWRQLVRLGVLLVHDVGTAEEIVQDCFVAVHARWTRLHDPDKALAYLRRSVVNRSRSHLRHVGVVRRHADRESPPEPAAGADQPAYEHARRERILDALRSLPRRQREVLALRYYLDLTEAEIAETLQISRGAVKSHASRGAAALRSQLGPVLEEIR
jgi:RNA polymerase sigma-70 factor (sigma-E family)